VHFGEVDLGYVVLEPGVEAVPQRDILAEQLDVVLLDEEVFFEYEELLPVFDHQIFLQELQVDVLVQDLTAVVSSPSLPARVRQLVQGRLVRQFNASRLSGRLLDPVVDLDVARGLQAADVRASLNIHFSPFSDRHLRKPNVQFIVFLRVGLFLSLHLLRQLRLQRVEVGLV